MGSDAWGQGMRLFGLPPGINLDTWRMDGDQGVRPGKAPYGLDGLIVGNEPVQLKSIPAAGKAELARCLFPSSSQAPNVFTWDERTALNASAAGLRLQGTGVIWLSDTRGPGAQVHRRLLRRALGMGSHVWALSSAQLPSLHEWFGSRSSIHHVLFGVDTEFFREQQPPTDPLVLSVGGDRDRDVATTLEALSIVKRQHPRARLVVQSRIAKAAPEGVELVASLNHQELREMYRQATVVAIATRENMHVSGMTVTLEAAATGRPTVATYTPGFEDYIADGETGLFTRRSDPQHMAQQISALLADPSHAARLGANAASRARACHTSVRLRSQIEAIMETAR